MPARLSRAALLAALFGVALWVRLRDLSGAVVLGDSVGPWLVAAAGPPWLHPHAPPYGWGLYVPYAAILPWCASLWSAVGALLVLHALAAPLAAVVAARLRSDAWAGAVVAGLAIALDGGLVDTALSGSKAYLGPLWVGVAALAAVGPGAALAPAALVMAVMNHPLAIAAAPLLALVPWSRRSSWAGAGLALLLLAPRVAWLASHPWPASGGLEGGVLVALLAFVERGGPGVWLLVAGPLVGLVHARTRPLALATLASLLLMVVLGGDLGYLRDHHLRLLAVPAAACLAGLPGWWALLGVLLLRLPEPPVRGDGYATRPGALGLETVLASTIVERVRGDFVVDGAWFSASPAAEPSALLLDLHLRGRAASPSAEQVVVVISAEREDLAQVGWTGTVLERGDRWLLVLGSVEEVRGWSAGLCAAGTTPRLGGAWDGLVAFHPELTLERSRTWWGCPS